MNENGACMTCAIVRKTAKGWLCGTSVECEAMRCSSAVVAGVGSSGGVDAPISWIPSGECVTRLKGVCWTGVKQMAYVHQRQTRKVASRPAQNVTDTGIAGAEVSAPDQVVWAPFVDDVAAGG